MCKRYCILVTFICLLGIPSLHAYTSDGLRVFDREHPLVYEDAWDLWPYSFLNANGEAVGYNIELVKLICQQLNIPYVIKLKPTQEALEDLKSGEADLMLAMAAKYHNAYGQYGKSVVQIFTHSVLRSKSDSITIKTEADLQHNRFIVHEGSFAHHFVKEKGWGNQAVPYNDMREAVQYIHNTPHQQIVWNTLSLKWLQRTLHFDNLELSPVKMRHGEYRFMSNQPALLQLIGQHGAVFGKQPVAQGKQRHGTIHRTRVNIHISDSLGQVLGHRAFSARGIAVDSNCNFLHRVYCIINLTLVINPLRGL